MPKLIPDRLRGRRPSPAIVISIISLVMASAGTATAAKVLITSSSQIKKNAVTGSDLADGTVANRDLKSSAVSGDKVRDGSLGLDDLESPARQALSNAGTQALEAFRKAGPQNVEAGKAARIATLSSVPPGTYAVFAKTVLTPGEPNGGLLGQGKPVSGHCVLDAGGDKDEARALLASPGAFVPGVLNLQITRSFSSAGTVTLDCDTAESSYSATDSTIIAIRVGAAPRTSVDG